MRKSIHVLELLSRGDTYNNIKGDTPELVLEMLAKIIRLPKGMDRLMLKSALIEREKLGSTAVGEGIAIPHPRAPIVGKGQATLSIGYLDTPVLWNAMDGIPVTSLFLLLSDDSSLHLAALSEIAQLMTCERFRVLMAKKPQKAELLQFLTDINF